MRNLLIKYRDSGSLNRKDWDETGFTHGLSAKHQDEIIILYNRMLDSIISDEDNKQKIDELSTLYLPMIRNIFSRLKDYNDNPIVIDMPDFKKDAHRIIPELISKLKSLNIRVDEQAEASLMCCNHYVVKLRDIYRDVGLKSYNRDININNIL